MRQFTRPSDAAAVLQPHLEAGETLRHWASGVRQPSVWLLLPLAALGIVPAVVAAFLLTKDYVVGLTDRRFVVLRMGASGTEPAEVFAYDLAALPPVTASTGPLFTHIRVQDPAQPFAAKFNKAGMPGNREHAAAIAAALTSGAAGDGAADAAPAAP